MATNALFKHYDTETEQDLVEDLIIEAIQIHGMDFYYLPRTLTNVSELYTEDRVYEYNQAIPIEVYPENINGFGGESDLISKFGLEIRDEVKFIMSQKRFRQEIGDPLGKYRPLEGDIIYMAEPFTQLFEITFVEHESTFYQLGKLYVYQLKCRLFENSNQVFNTGVGEIDQLGNVYDHNLERVPLVDESDEVLATDDGQSLVVSDAGAVYEDNRSLTTTDGHILVTENNEVLITSDEEPGDASINDFLESFGGSLINFDEQDAFTTGTKY